ncbi:MAG: 4Fe-4S dicluster domain-containing protein [Candidatus Omnitrophota bacterium]
MLNKARKFRGGYIFKKPACVLNSGIEKAAIPSKVTIPLKLRFGTTITPLVKIGDRVRAGEIIARDDETISTPAISSVNGEVSDILQINYYYGKVDAVVILSDGTEDHITLGEAGDNYSKLSFEKISELIYTSGAASLGKSGIPTIFKSSPARPKSINDLIITTFDTGPFSLDNRIIFKARGGDFFKGIAILKRALPNAKVTIAIDRKNTVFSKEIIDALRGGAKPAEAPDWIFVQPLDKKYPQESEEMLARTILAKKIPLGGLGTDIGVLILDIHAVQRVYEAVALGKPYIERTVALAGSACKWQKCVNFRIGMPLRELIGNNIKDGKEFRAIFGNAMTGILQKDLSVPVGRSIGHVTVLEETKTRQPLAFLRLGARKDSYSRAFLSSCLSSPGIEYDSNTHGELRPCIQCGYCDEVCPVGIIPHLLHKQIHHGICEGAQRLGIFECIDCGLCSYVCPCKIPLADDIASGKMKLIEEGCTVPSVKVKESEAAAKLYRGRMPL